MSKLVKGFGVGFVICMLIGLDYVYYQPQISIPANAAQWTSLPFIRGLLSHRS